MANIDKQQLLILNEKYIEYRNLKTVVSYGSRFVNGKKCNCSTTYVDAIIYSIQYIEFQGLKLMKKLIDLDVKIHYIFYNLNMFKDAIFYFLPEEEYIMLKNEYKTIYPDHSEKEIDDIIEEFNKKRNFVKYWNSINEHIDGLAKNLDRGIEIINQSIAKYDNIKVVSYSDFRRVIDFFEKINQD